MANTNHSITTYLSDMLAVEKHIKVPFDTQRADGDMNAYQDTQDVLTRLCAITDQHIATLEATLEELGGHEAAPAKNTVTQIEGAVAGLIDKMRKTKVSKALRDDYTALGLAAVSYSELLATADGLGATSVSTIAQRHLEDYAGLIMEIGECVPAVVLRELSQDGLPVDTSVSESTRRKIEQSWRSRAQSARSSGSIYGETDPLEQDEPIVSRGSDTLL
jgi:ferritin-like metal-binding protein YciE